MDKLLSIGYRLNSDNDSEYYIITGILGRGATVVAYSVDYHNDLTGLVSKRILKEYNPININFKRDVSGFVNVSENDITQWNESLARFKLGCQRQNEIRNLENNMNQTPFAISLFYANGTMYYEIAAQYGEVYNKTYADMDLIDRLKVCRSTGKIIMNYHSAGYLCLDIKPDNIVVLPETKDLVFFIDFDSVRKKDEILFGNSLSYTENWAAPEQQNPYDYRKVCERTDIYAIGELLYWSVFENHSTMEQHWSFSTYPFDSCVKFKNDLDRVRVRNLLTEIFVNTLRSSVNNRFDSLDPLISLLNELIDELSKKEYIINTVVRPKDFFLGRDSEIKAISAALLEHSIVFLTGIGGIGKSEVAKHFYVKNSFKYNNALYLTYNSDLECMICDDECLKIANVERNPLEKDNNKYYCERKLTKLKNIMSGNNLIIIDNFNLRLDEIEDNTVWKSLKALPTHILVITRCLQNTYFQISINEIENQNHLNKLFENYCPFSNDERKAVEGIIAIVKKHTLTIELVAKTICADHSTPEDMFSKLQSSGMSGLDENNIELVKDETEKNTTALAHLNVLFDMASMSNDNMMTLLKLAFVDTSGIGIKQFRDFYSIENCNSINWLSNHGWIYIENNRLSVHPVIAKIIIDKCKSVSKYIVAFYNDAIKSISRNANILASTANKTREHGITCKEALVFLIMYVDRQHKYGIYGFSLSAIEFAINNYRQYCKDRVYSAGMEYAYILYVQTLIHNGRITEGKQIAEEHIIQAKNNKDYYMTVCWYSIFDKVNDGASFSYLATFYKFMQILSSDIRRKKPKYISEKRLLCDLDYDYLYERRGTFLWDVLERNTYNSEEYVRRRIIENDSFIVLKSVLKVSIKNRLRICEKDNVLNNNMNSCFIALDYAYISYIKLDFDDAKDKAIKIQEHLEKLKCSNSICSLYAHSLLGFVYYKQKIFDLSKREFLTCTKICKILNENNYWFRIYLASIYNELGDYIESERVSNELYKELKSLSDKLSNSLIAEVLYNIADMYLKKGEYEKSYRYFNMSNNRFIKEHKILKEARCYRKMADASIIINNDDIVTDCTIRSPDSLLKDAIDNYKRSIGAKHQETIECINVLTDLNK